VAYSFCLLEYVLLARGITPHWTRVTISRRLILIGRNSKPRPLIILRIRDLDETVEGISIQAAELRVSVALLYSAVPAMHALVETSLASDAGVAGNHKLLNQNASSSASLAQSLAIT